MKISRIISSLTLIILGVFLTTKAYANGITPLIAFAFSGIIIPPILIAIICIEAVVLKVYLPSIRWLEAFKSAALSNIASAVAGIPFAFIIVFTPIIQPVIEMLPSRHIFFLVLFILFFFFSSVIETWVNKRVLRSTIAAHQIRKATWIANVASYISLYILVSYLGLLT